MPVLIAIPFLTLLVIFQSAIFSQVRILHGTADLVLLALIAWPLQEKVRAAWQWTIIGGLMVSLVSALPLGVPLIGYLMTTGLAGMLKQRVWKVPILAMFVVTFIGTLITHGTSLLALLLKGSSIALIEALNQITLPSLLLNLILAVPMYIIVADLAGWLYPKELEV